MYLYPQRQLPQQMDFFKFTHIGTAVKTHHTLVIDYLDSQKQALLRLWKCNHQIH